jgi:hypothetical protein
MISNIEQKNRQLSNVWKLWENARSYAQTIGVRYQIPENVKFFEGDQWATPTVDTLLMPRPVLNIIRLIINTLTSNILAVPPKLRFISYGDEYSTEMFTQFADYIVKEIKMDELDEIAVQDGKVKGTFCYYFYWDKKGKGTQGNFKGSLRGEIIDPLHIAVADPTIKDTQRQEWIIIDQKFPVKAVREMAEELTREEIELIKPDDLEPNYDNEREQDDSELCTVLTRFFRIDGEVYFEKATKNVLLHKPIPLNPYLVKVNDDLTIDTDNDTEEKEEKIDTTVVASNDNELEEKKTYKKFTSSLYPIVIGSLTPSNTSIYGLSQVRELIPNQKSINYNMAMILLNTQQVAWGKILVKANALQGQTINNMPGQVITDYSPGTGFGVTNMPGQQILSNGALELTSSLIELTRMVTNADEIMTGDMIGSNLSGYAIALLDEKKRTNVDKEQRRFWRYKEEIGQILKQFFITHYIDEEFSFDLSDSVWQKAQDYNRNNGNQKVSRRQQGVFNGQDYADIPFDVVCEAGGGSRFSEVMVMQQADNLLQQGLITFKQYCKIHPNLAFKTELISQIEADEVSELNQTKQALMEASQVIERQQNDIKALGGSIQQYEQYTKNLTKAFEDRINVANQEIKNRDEFMSKIQGSPIQEKKGSKTKGSNTKN